MTCCCSGLIDLAMLEELLAQVSADEKRRGAAAAAARAVAGPPGVGVVPGVALPEVPDRARRVNEARSASDGWATQARPCCRAISIRKSRWPCESLLLRRYSSKSRSASTSLPRSKQRQASPRVGDHVVGADPQVLAAVLQDGVGVLAHIVGQDADDLGRGGRRGRSGRPSGSPRVAARSRRW